MVSNRYIFGWIIGFVFVFVQVINYKALTGCFVMDQHDGAFGHILNSFYWTTKAKAGTSTTTEAKNYVRLTIEETASSSLSSHGNNNMNSDLSELSTTTTTKKGETTGSFGACLMIMDDNHFLVEWIAYHYYALPLKHLTVYIDSKSQTSPLPVLDRWSELIHIDIVNWAWPGVLAPVPEYLQNQTAIRNYIGRQNMFYGDCMKTYKRRNWKSWVILTDTDEFIGANRYVNNKAHPINDGIIPSMNEYGAISKRLKQLSEQGVKDTCIMTNRTQACDEQPNHEIEIASSLLGPEYKDKDFLTMRWDLGHSLKNPKGMINIGSIEKEYFEQMDALNTLTAHVIAPNHECPSRPYFRLYHYPGSEEQQTFRDSIDPRGPAATRIGGSRPLFKRIHRPIPVQHIQIWLGGFIKYVGGKYRAKQLLKGVGQVHSWPPYHHK